MFTPEFWAENWIKLVFGLISTGIITYLGFLLKKFKNYKSLMEEKDEEAINEMVEKKIAEIIKPIQKELEIADNKFEVILESYRYRLLTLCEIYLDRGYLTPKEYHQLSEMWKVYHGLGGNSQASNYYHKVENLPVREQ